MLKRLGPGPVFTYEWLVASRRWQLYAIRSLFVTTLLVGLAFVWCTKVSGRDFSTFRDLATVGDSFYLAYAGVQLSLILTAAPAAMAGVICVDKSRGTLIHLMITDLSDTEIVLGKLLARLIPMVGLIACTIPVLALGTLLGGIDPWMLAAASMVALGLALLSSTLALVLSVWAYKPHEVLFACYSILAIWILARPTWGFALRQGWNNWPEYLDPLGLTFANAAGIRVMQVFPNAVIFLVLCSLASILLTWLSVRKIRKVAIRQASRGGVKPARGLVWRTLQKIPRALPRWSGPSLDGNPVLWREWHRNRPSGWILTLLVVYALIVGTFSLATIVLVVLDAEGQDGVAPWITALGSSVGFLLLAVVVSTSLTEERARGSLDVLLTTPLPTRAIVMGKWWGAYRLVPWLVVSPVLITLAFSWSHHKNWLVPWLVAGWILAYGAALTSLGLALATWLPRVGRVLVTTITIHLLITVGWFALTVNLRDHEFGQGLAEASSFFAPGMLTALMYDASPSRMQQSAMQWAVGWIILYSAVAFGLLQATLGCFDRCLGRVSEDVLRHVPNAKTELKNEHVSTHTRTL